MAALGVLNALPQAVVIIDKTSRVGGSGTRVMFEIANLGGEAHHGQA